MSKPLKTSRPHLTKDTSDKHFLDYGTKVNYKNLPYPLKDIIGYDEIEATAGLALAQLRQVTDKPLLKERRYFEQAMCWKTAELLKKARFTRHKTCKSRWVNQAPENAEGDLDFFSHQEAKDERTILQVLDRVEGLSLQEYAWLYHRFIVGLTRDETVKLMNLNTYTRQVVSTGARKKIREAMKP